ncbi:MAG: hypothetical protein WC838_05420 [Candidatus Margulisiibacteriota bacterium]|jgi:hypothetical protein
MKTLTLSILLLVTLYLSAYAVPVQLDASGRILQNGALVNEPLTMTFKLWDAATTGNLLWSTNNISVEVYHGSYSIVLAPVSPNVLSGDNTWLEMTIGVETLVPRTKITSVAYAMQAGGLSAGGGNTVAVSISGNVGIGVALPLANLHLAPGTSSNAALIIPSGNLLTNTFSGAIENDGTYLYYTDPIPERHLLNKGNLTQEPTGFHNRTDTTLAFNSGSRQFTITGTNFQVYSKGRVYTKNTEIITIANTVGIHFIYYDKATLALSESTLPWRTNDGTVMIATVYWDGTTGLIGEERHGVAMDGQTHAFLHSTVGSRYNSGMAGSFSSPPAFSIAAGSFNDEDIEHSWASAQTTCRVLYRSGTVFTYTAPQSTYYLESGGTVQYDLNGTPTNVTNGNYVAYWIFASNDPATPIYALAGQRQDTSLANAQNNNTYESLSLIGLPFQEMKLLYRVILQRSGSNETFQEAVDNRLVVNVPAGTYLATAHGLMSGLSADDHGQYVLLSGRSTDQNLIGAATVNGTLVLRGNAAVAGNTAASPNVQIKAGNAGQTTALTVLNNGNIGLGTPTPSERLVVTGSIVATQFYAYEITQNTYSLGTTTNILNLATIPNGLYLVTGHGVTDEQYYQAYLDKSGGGTYTLIDALYNYFRLDISGSNLRLITAPALAVNTKIHLLGATTY